MPVLADLGAAEFRLTGADMEPSTSLEWHMTTPDQRHRYFQQLAVYARDAKYTELNKGIGVDGQRLPPRKRPRHDRASGPVLLPHWSDSRFRTQLRWEGTSNEAVLWWQGSWGTIVGYHARGEVRGAPVRNVIGLSPQSQRRVAEQARKWWQGQIKSGRVGVGVNGPPTLQDLMWHQTPPPRPVGSIFGTPPKPPVMRAPQIVGPLPPWTLQQRLHGIWEAAGQSRTTRDELEKTAARVGRTQPLATLRDLLRRWGVTEVPATKKDATELIRRNLLGRLGPS